MFNNNYMQLIQMINYSVFWVEQQRNDVVLLCGRSLNLAYISIMRTSNLGWTVNFSGRGIIIAYYQNI